MQGKGTLRGHTRLSLERMAQLQLLADRIVAPNCIRKNRMFYLGLGVMAVAVGAVCGAWSGLLWVGLVFGGVGALCLLWAALVYRILAWRAWKGLDRRAVASDFVLGKRDLWIANGTGDHHYPYEEIARLLEMEGAFFLLTRAGDTLVLDKEGLEGGSPDDLRDWLTERCALPAEQVGADGRLSLGQMGRGGPAPTEKTDRGVQ